MCRGGRILCEFVAGAEDRPDVPEPVAECLTTTDDGLWVVWAHKVAIAFGDLFVPLTGGDPYPRHAAAMCKRGGGHDAPQRNCTCGFHALSRPFPDFGRDQLEVVLSGRIVAAEWESGGVLFRAARQTVIRVQERTKRRRPTPPPPADPSGRLAALRQTGPRGAGPVRLLLPGGRPLFVEVDDDAGYCVRASLVEMT
jgi:hypothetical protein